MEVKPYCINKGTAAEYYGLMAVEDNPVDIELLGRMKIK